MQDFRIIAQTLPGLLDPSVAIAASRAGGIGVLDLQYTRDVAAARASLTRLTKYARGEAGVRLDADAPDFIAALVADLREPVKLVILNATEPQRLRHQLETLREKSLSILLEATCLEQALQGQELGVDGLVVKGHEAGGWVGEETSFILLQRLRAQVSLPLWVQGGISLHSAAACYVAGAAGVLLDGQLALTRESSLPAALRQTLARMDGSETICLGSEWGDERFRVYTRPGHLAIEELREAAGSMSRADGETPENGAAWRAEVRRRVGWESFERNLWPLGQDAAFAAPLAERFKTVGGVLEAIRRAAIEHTEVARSLQPLGEGSPLARSHGTRYPIVQGPMTRVSDIAAFASEVAKGGALPFLALALLRAQEVRRLLEETREALGERPWGVGILGFVPLDLRQEQLEVVREFKPAFALIAGGRPDQALNLERDGTPTYLHVPSPGLLKLFVENGARRFVFEGRECGGHVGPRTSFVLWNTMVETLLSSLSPADFEDCHLLFAGGIHDAVSAAMVAALAAPLAERGAKVGVLLGTAYLFTKEAVATRAIMEGFQQESVQCHRTVLLESGPGHATRCAATPFAQVFVSEKQRLSSSGKSAEEIRQVLEDLNLGRLRIASKGISRHPLYQLDPQAPKFADLNVEEQHTQGMYMIGQLAALRDATCTIDELHREVSIKSSELLSNMGRDAARVTPSHAAERPSDVAIIGMSCLMPKAPNLEAYWHNILNKVDAITEVPASRWEWERYFDADPKAPDKVYSRWGGFLDDVPFDPMRYGIPPSSLPSIEPLQLLTLEVVREALQDAGYAERPFNRERTSVILGVGGGIADLGQHYALRSGLPKFFDEIPEEVLARLPEWTEDSFAGILLNVAAGRVANRFDFGGVNYTVDAACASSLAAVYLAARELEVGSSEMVIVGGADTVQNIFGYMCFSKTHALSPRGHCYTFDESADGIAISEGLAVLVLKRLADAERDGDRIYAVIKSVAGSSDGRDKGLTAPRPEGQALALRRAYAKAGFSPATVGLIEAHGTGTVAGDQAEVSTLKLVFDAAGAARQRCAIGSVKSMVGHTKCTAGVAGIIKVALALHHQVLPPTINVTKPNSKARFPDSPFYVNTELRPWMNAETMPPRRAGVSAFGFGGTNFHAVLEEYTGGFLPHDSQAVARQWSSELFLWSGSSREEIVSAIESLTRELDTGAEPVPGDLAYTLWHRVAEGQRLRLALVATSLADLRQKLDRAREALIAPGEVDLWDARGIYFKEQPLGREGKLAFLFPGQGSQYPDMLRELGVHFAEVRRSFQLADRVLSDAFPQPLSAYVFPPPVFSQAERDAQQQALTRTDVAQSALGTADIGLFNLLRSLGLKPDMLAGHSYGEYAALCAAGVFDEETLFRISEARGRSIIEAAESDLGTMAAVEAGAESIREILSAVEGVWIANLNAPGQTIISGTRAGIELALERLAAARVKVHPVAVSCAFHSPLVAPARDRMAVYLSSVEFGSPQQTVFSNTTAAPYPQQPTEIAALLTEHLVRPVKFAEEVEAMYEAGARIFMEVGPRSVLTSLVSQILSGREHLAVASDVAGRSSLLQLQHALGQLAAHGVGLNLGRLYEGRGLRLLRLEALLEETRRQPLSPTTWMVNGGEARPLRATSAAASPVEKASNKAVNRTSSTKPAPVIEPVAPLVETPVPAAAHMYQQSVPEAAQLSSIKSSPTGPHMIDAAPSPIATDAQAQSHLAGPTTASIAPVHSNGDGRHQGDEQVMLQFQHLMSRFLETQQQVMLAYLQNSNGESVAPLASHQEAQATATPHAPQTPPSLHAPAPHHVQAAIHAPAPEIALESDGNVPRFERAEIEQVLLALVSEKTGYPAEMLDRNLNLEADLGIDSIKRVEIIGALERRTGLIGAEMEQASRLGTLQALIDFLNERLSSSAPLAQEEEVSLKSYEPSGAGKSNGSNGSHAALSSLLTDETQPALNEQQLTQKLLQIVSERTGYPAEMLDLDLNLEADLGVDSIKRVEIIGAFQRDCLSPHQPTSHELVERLTGIKTLRGIIETSGAALSLNITGPTGPLDITGPVGPLVAGASPASAKSLQDEPKLDQQKLDQPRAGLSVPRFTLRAVDAPLPLSETAGGIEGLFVITDDEGGIAQALSEALRERGGLCMLVRQGDETVEVAPGLYTANIIEAASVARLFELIRERHGALAGLMHLLPLRMHAKLSELNLDQWHRCLREEVKSFFYMARAASAELKNAALKGGGWLLAATSMGGTFGFDADDPFIFPGQGGLAGLVKTLAVEWPGVRCKAVDLDRSAPSTLLCEHLLAEITGHDGEVEVGYTQSRRLSLRPVPAPLNPHRGGGTLIDSNSVVLVTGGARGITSEVVREMAARYRPTLLLVGHMAAPAAEESQETAGLESTQEIKAALMEQLRRAGQPFTPAQVEAAYLRLMKEREFARNISSIREAGARVQYFQADVRDEHSFGQLIDEIYRAYGRIDGVIHGAGTIEDKLVEDKTPDSFDRVFDTKADSTFILSRKLRADSLKFFLAFSSVAGRFGNRGQGDYAAGNEAMNRLVAQLDRAWPGRVAALDWNPWQKGMASPQVQQQFRERGVQVVSPEAGRSAFILELEAGRKGEVEVVLGGGPWERAAQAAGKATKTTEARSLPLLDGVAHASAPGGAIELTRELDPSSDLYLLDHLLDERPVFPAAMAMELMAEATQRGWPDLSVVGLESFRVLKGIVLDGAGRKSVRVTARPETQPEQEGLELAVDLTISEGLEKGDSYRATVLLNDHLRAAPQTDLPPLGQLHPFQMSVAEAYERWLFHGPSLQGIASIEGINERGMLATLLPCAPARCLRGTSARAWLIDPVVMDSAFQLAILWMRTHHDMTPLPAGFRRYRLYAPRAGQSLRCDFRARTSAGGHVLETQVVFMDEQGRVLSVLEDMEFSCSRSLNRLAGRAMMRARHE